MHYRHFKKTGLLIIDLESKDEFIAGDKTILRQILHPDKAEIATRYSMAHATLKPGDSSTPHALKTSEVYYILEGEGEMQIDDEKAPVRTGHTVYIPPHAKQSIWNTGNTDLKFLCIVDPAWRQEDELIF